MIRYERGLVWVAISLVVAGLACDSKPIDRLAPGPLVVRVQPFTVVGQADGEYLGEAFAESLAGALAQSAEVEIVAGATNGARPNPHVIEGALALGSENRLEVRLLDPIDGSTEWERRIPWARGTLSALGSNLARQLAEAMKVHYPTLYGSMDDLRAGEAMAASPQWEASREWRRLGTAERLERSAELVAAFPADATAHVVDAWAIMLAWDANPSNGSYLLQLQERLAALEQVDPSSPYDDLIGAYVYRASGEPNRSRVLCSRVIGRTDLSNAARAWALRQRSLAQLQAGNATAAQHDAREAGRLDPVNALSLIALSKSLESLGEFETAIAVSTEALRLEPDQWRHHQRLGIVYGRSGDRSAAALSLKRACDLSDSQEACANLAVELQRAGRPAEAATAAQYAAALPGTPFGLYNLACYRALAGRNSAAVFSLGRAIELGFADSLIETDRDLDSLRSDPDFSEILQVVHERVSERRKISGSVFPWQS